jgi:hypothetical protein
MKRLYEMGGDIITDNFFTAASDSATIGGKGKKKKKIKDGSGNPMKKGRYKRCKSGICT